MEPTCTRSTTSMYAANVGSSSSKLRSPDPVGRFVGVPARLNPLRAVASASATMRKFSCSFFILS